MEYSDVRDTRTFDYAGLAAQAAGEGALQVARTAALLLPIPFGLLTLPSILAANRAIVLVGLAIFGFMGPPLLFLAVCNFRAAQRYRQSAENESIAVFGNRIVWTGPDGAVRLDTRLDRLISVRARRAYCLNPSGHAVYFVQTSDGELRFSDRISHCADLAFLLRAQTEGAGETRVYRPAASSTVLAAVMVATMLGPNIRFISGPTTMPIGHSGEPAGVSGAWACGAILLFLDVVLGRYAAWAILRALLERVELTGDRIVYYDWRGRKRCDAKLEQLRGGHLRKVAQDSWTYTLDGQIIQWDDSYLGAMELLDLLRLQ